MVLEGIEVPVGGEPIPGRGSSGADRRTLLALAMVESRRLARHPLIAAGVLLSIALFWRETAMDSPALQRDSVYLAKSLLPLSVAAVFATNLLGLRDRRLGSEEMLAGLRHDSQTRWTARCLASLVSVAWGVVLLAAFLATLVLREAVGSPAWAELAIGLGLVGCGGFAGLVLARWAPTPIAPAVVLTGLVVASFVLEGDGTNRSRWLAPFVDFTTRSDAIELARRPAGLHLLALVGVATALAVVVGLRRGLSRVLLAVATISLTVGAGALQLREASTAEVARARAFALQREEVQQCDGVDRVRVCMYPGYRGWTEDYLTVAETVLADVPPDPRESQFVVEQRVGRLPLAAYPTDVLIEVNAALYVDRPRDTAFVGMAKSGGADSLDFRSAVGMWAVGLPPAPRPGERTFASEFDALGGNPANVYCAAADSRPALGLWLAVRGDAVARQDLEELAELAVDSANTTGIYLVTAGGVIVEPRQAQLAARLLNLPPNDVAAALNDHWEAVRAGELSSDDLREALNLEATGEEPAGGLSGGIPTPPPCS